MIYLLYGEDDFSINLYIEKLLKSNNIESINVSKYNGDNDFDLILQDASTISFFSSQKAVLINDYEFSNLTDRQREKWKKYESSPNKQTILIFLYHREDIKSISKYFDATVKKIEFKKEKNINKIVSDMFRPYQISSKSIELFIERVGDNLYNIQNEVDKIKLYKMDNQIITNEDIINLTFQKSEDNIFKFIDQIITKDKINAIKSYHMMIDNGEEPIKIIVLVANKFRLMFQVKVLRREGHSEEEIANILKVKKYPVILALRNGQKYTEKSLIDNLLSLANLDIDIKSGEKDKNLAFELFLLKL